MKSEHFSVSSFSAGSDNPGGEVDTSHITTDAEMHFRKTLTPPLIGGEPQEQGWLNSTGCIDKENQTFYGDASQD